MCLEFRVLPSLLKLVSNADSHQGRQAHQDPKGPQDPSESLDHK